MKTELSEQARQARNEYQRKYRLKNPDKIKQYNAAYWERKAAREVAEEAEAFRKWLAHECQVCGQQIEGKREGAKFCSDACRQKHHRQGH